MRPLLPFRKRLIICEKYISAGFAVIDSRLLAILGPTNTGKTHFAVERMLGHASGMIGLPLRLLAREIYDRCVRIKGADKVALITGEEKLLPAGREMVRLHRGGHAAGSPGRLPGNR